MRGVPCRPPPSTTTRGTGGEAAGGWAQGSAEARPGARRRSSAAFLGGENGEGVGGSGTLASPHPLPAPGVPSRPAAAHLSPARPRVSAPRRGPLVSPPRRRGRGEAREETIWATYFPAPPCVCVRPAPRPGVPGGGRIFGGVGGGGPGGWSGPAHPQGSGSAAGRHVGTPHPSGEGTAAAGNGIRLKAGKG